MNKLLLLLAIILSSCGQAGPAGKDGQSIQGSPGFNSLMFFTRQSNVTGCENSGLVVANGVDINRNSLLDSDEIQVISYICDGTDGIDGVDGTNGVNGTNGTNAPSSEFEIINIITPCGKKAGVFNESLLELSNGDILAYLEQGSNRFLSVLSPGEYKTTDSKNCKFSIDNNGNYRE